VVGVRGVHAVGAWMHQMRRQAVGAETSRTPIEGLSKVERQVIAQGNTTTSGYMIEQASHPQDWVDRWFALAPSQQDSRR